MAKYQLTDNGVLDTETNASIPNNNSNRHWKKYQEWLSMGNIPDLLPAPYIKTNEDHLKESDVKMIRAIDWMLQVLVQNGTIQLTDLPQQLKDLYLERKVQRGA